MGSSRLLSVANAAEHGSRFAILGKGRGCGQALGFFLVANAAVARITVCTFWAREGAVGSSRLLSVANAAEHGSRIAILGKGRGCGQL